jgi:nicotinamidase-related amidase
MNSRVAVFALDLQRDFLEDGGRMPVASAHVDPLLASANAAIDRAVAAQVPVVYVFNAFPRSAWLPNLFRRGAAPAGSRGGQSSTRAFTFTGMCASRKNQATLSGTPRSNRRHGLDLRAHRVAKWRTNGRPYRST